MDSNPEIQPSNPITTRRKRYFSLMNHAWKTKIGQHPCKKTDQNMRSNAKISEWKRNREVGGHHKRLK